MTGSRRTMLAGLTAAGAFWSVAAPAQEFPDTTRAKIVEAFTYAYPVYEAARTRYRAAFAAPAEDSALNRLHHSRLLADHTSRWVTTPNNDTLYSTAFLDLTGGPVEITTPEFGDRYFSVAFMDAYTNNFAIIGRRATGGHPQRYLVVGPHWTGAAPPGDKLIRAPGDWVWTLVRTLIDGPADLDEAPSLGVLGLLSQTRTGARLLHEAPPFKEAFSFLGA